MRTLCRQSIFRRRLSIQWRRSLKADYFGDVAREGDRVTRSVSARWKREGVFEEASKSVGVREGGCIWARGSAHSSF